jgi:DNA-binding GntR family transcriptional regulator
MIGLGPVDPDAEHAMALAASQPLTKQERVYQTVRERILTGEYGPGFRVVIDTLAGELGVSALPVREAVRRLEAEGLIVYRPNAGAQVTPADPGLFDEEMTALAVLEGFATALAASELSTDAIARLTELTDAMEEAMRRMDALAFGRLNQEFHGVIYEACPNRALVAMLHEVGRRLDAIRRTVFVQIPYRGAESVAEHRALIELIVSGAELDEVERAAREHKLRTVASFRAWRAERDIGGEMSS